MLDDDWAANAGEQIAALESQAVAMTEANAALTAARSRVRRLSDLPEPHDEGRRARARASSCAPARTPPAPS